MEDGEPLPQMRERSHRRGTVSEALEYFIAALPEKKVAAFALGHVLNDLYGSVWFAYTLVLLHKIIGFSSTDAAFVLLAGQFADGIATPIVGILSDKEIKGVSPAGRRRLWYSVGTFIVFINFFFLFAHCVACDANYDTSRTTFAYFILTAVGVNVGFPSEKRARRNAQRRDEDAMILWAFPIAVHLGS
jgi:predicted MFS family arabinose efflux permease